MMCRVLWIICMIFIAAGCTNRGVYDGVQAGARNDCYKLPDDQMSDCLDRLNNDYDTYKRERDEVMQEKVNKK